MGVYNPVTGNWYKLCQSSSNKKNGESGNMSDELNTKLYEINVCPNCKSDRYFEVRTGGGGLFSFDRFQCYRCEECNFDFKFPTIERVISEKTVGDLVKRTLENEYTYQYMRDKFYEMGIILLSKQGLENQRKWNKLKNEGQANKG